MQNCHYQLIIISSFTLAQLLILVIFGYTPYPDSDGYQLLAQQCVQYNECYPVESKLNEYAFLWNLGAVNAVVWSLYLFHSVTPLLVVYSLMKGATAWLLYAIAKKILTPRTAVIALVLYVLYPANYGEGTSALSELPFMFFCLLLVCAVLSLFAYRSQTHLLPLSCIIIGTLLLLFVGHGEARFHIPFMPFVILLASAYLQKLLCKKTE